MTLAVVIVAASVVVVVVVVVVVAAAAAAEMGTSYYEANTSDDQKPENTKGDHSTYKLHLSMLAAYLRPLLPRFLQ